MVRTVRDQIEYETYRKMILAHVGLVGFTLLFAIIFLAVRPRFEAQYTGVLLVLAMLAAGFYWMVGLKVVYYRRGIRKIHDLERTDPARLSAPASGDGADDSL